MQKRQNVHMQNMRLRMMRESDLPAVAALNAAADPEVQDIGEDGLRDLLAMCDVALVATDASGEILAFVMSLGMGHPYASENYRWFEQRGVRHQYIDRIVVAPRAKGTGLGSALYASVLERARERGALEVTCEVNLDPPNPTSIAFHERLGFRRLAEQDTRGGTVRVALMARGVWED